LASRRWHQVIPRWALVDRLVEIDLAAQGAEEVTRRVLRGYCGPRLYIPSLSGGLWRSAPCDRSLGGGMQHYRAFQHWGMGRSPMSAAARVQCASCESSMCLPGSPVVSCRAGFAASRAAGGDAEGRFRTRSEGGAGRPRERATGGAPSLLIHRVISLHGWGGVTLC
jgi:hypothetical protein